MNKSRKKPIVIGRKTNSKKQRKPNAASNLVAPVPSVSQIIMRPIKAGRLKTSKGWLHLAGRIMHAVLRGDIPKREGAQMFYMINIGSQAASKYEEIAKLQEMNAHLDAIEGRKTSGLGYMPPGPLDGAQVISGDPISVQNTGESP